MAENQSMAIEGSRQCFTTLRMLLSFLFSPFGWSSPWLSQFTHFLLRAGQPATLKPGWGLRKDQKSWQSPEDGHGQWGQQSQHQVSLCPPSFNFLSGHAAALVLVIRLNLDLSPTLQEHSRAV